MSNPEFAAGQAGIGVFMDRYWRDVHAVAFSLLGNHSDSEDAMQNAFRTAFLHWHELRDRDKALPWLLRILRRECARLHRDRGRRMAELPGDGNDPAAPAPHTDDERHRALQAAIAGLPDRCREIVVLRYEREWDVARIAGELDIPEHTVWNDLRSAKKLLVEAMRRHLT